ncbi:hypothetical protein BHM03_00008089 [Ensete ventricosum]|nr:hypothetical protein BHM03_00008089 [Ensete ventricosum]
MGVAPLRAGRDRRCPYSLVAGKQPLVGWPLAAGGASARRQPSCLCRPSSRSPACGLLPLRVAAPCRGPGRNRSPPCSRPGRGWEIVYPCIPYPDGEDEEGQASSSLAVSTRWIFAAKLLQSGLTTLAQREGGE